jgi:hypothetical protein
MVFGTQNFTFDNRLDNTCLLFKFEPSFLTYFIILLPKPYSSNKLINSFANACPIVLEALNKSRVTFLEFQLNPQKIMTTVNTSRAPLDT